MKKAEEELEVGTHTLSQTYIAVPHPPQKAKEKDMVAPFGHLMDIEG